MKPAFYFEENTKPVEELYGTISSVLKEHAHCQVEFTKKDGSTRIMNCTWDSNFMRPQAVQEFHQTRTIDYNTITVWDEEKQDWRAFKTSNVKSIKAI